MGNNGSSCNDAPIEVPSAEKPHPTRAMLQHRLLSCHGGIKLYEVTTPDTPGSPGTLIHQSISPGLSLQLRWLVDTGEGQSISLKLAAATGACPSYSLTYDDKPDFDTKPSLSFQSDKFVIWAQGCLPPRISLILTVVESLAQSDEPAKAKVQDTNSLIYDMIDRRSPADVCFIVGGQRLYACSRLLRQCSPVWRDQLPHIPQDSGNTLELVVQDMDPTVFRTLLHWAHSGCPSQIVDGDKFSFQTLLTLFSAAKRFSLAPLHTSCIEKIKGSLTAPTVASVAFTASCLMHEEVKAIVWEFMLENWALVEGSAAWREVLGKLGSGKATIYNALSVFQFLANIAQNRALPEEPRIDAEPNTNGIRNLRPASFGSSTAEPATPDSPTPAQSTFPLADAADKITADGFLEVEAPPMAPSSLPRSPVPIWDGEETTGFPMPDDSCLAKSPEAPPVDEVCMLTKKKAGVKKAVESKTGKKGKKGKTSTAAVPGSKKLVKTGSSPTGSTCGQHSSSSM